MPQSTILHVWRVGDEEMCACCVFVYPDSRHGHDNEVLRACCTYLRHIASNCDLHRNLAAALDSELLLDGLLIMESVLVHTLDGVLGVVHVDRLVGQLQ